MSLIFHYFRHSVMNSLKQPRTLLKTFLFFFASQIKVQLQRMYFKADKSTNSLEAVSSAIVVKLYSHVKIYPAICGRFHPMHINAQGVYLSFMCL